MNKRIFKFRVWDKEENRFLEDMNGWGLLFSPISAQWEGINWFAQSSRYEVEQFTGLKDKNDKEIYEGDIIKVTYYPKKHFVKSTERGTVIFKEGSFMFETVESDIAEEWIRAGELKEYAKNILEDRQCKIKITGNIHENPELLK